MSEAVNRRRLLGTAALAAGGVPLLAACGGGTAGGAGSPSATTAGGAPGEVVARTADVPVGGGVFDTDLNIVVTQPVEGEFRAFSSICTHQHCPIKTIEDDLIVCTCHFSKFSIVDGSVQAGPAPEPLEEFAVVVEGDGVVLS